MHRTLRALPLIVLAVTLGASAGFAQSSSAGSAASESSRATGLHEQQERSHQKRNRQVQGQKASRPSRRELMSMMKANVGSVRGAGLRQNVDLKQGAVGRNIALEGGAVQLTDLPMGSRRPQEEAGSRRIYYIVGGALVAGGLVAGILALSGDDGGRPGIPRPPGRPSQ